MTHVHCSGRLSYHSLLGSCQRLYSKRCPPAAKHRPSYASAGLGPVCSQYGLLMRLPENASSSRFSLLAHAVQRPSSAAQADQPTCGSLVRALLRWHITLHFGRVNVLRFDVPSGGQVRRSESGRSFQPPTRPKTETIVLGSEFLILSTRSLVSHRPLILSSSSCVSLLRVASQAMASAEVIACDMRSDSERSCGISTNASAACGDRVAHLQGQSSNARVPTKSRNACIRHSTADID